MISHTIWAFDPGKVTGFAMGEFSKTDSVRLDGFDAVPYDGMVPFLKHLAKIGPPDYLVCEQFLARTNNKFVADDTPKKVEGLIESVFGPTIIYRPRTKKEQVPDRVLKEHGLWKTGKDVDWEDGRDVNDAIIHMLGFVAFDLRHLPTLREYFKRNETHD